MGLGFRLEILLKPEIRAAADKEPPPPRAVRLRAAARRRRRVHHHRRRLPGQRGFFSRDDTGAVVGVDLAGRLFRRVPAIG
jgi:hypothetical protein